MKELGTKVGGWAYNTSWAYNTYFTVLAEEYMYMYFSHLLAVRRPYEMCRCRPYSTSIQQKELNVSADQFIYSTYHCYVMIAGVTCSVSRGSDHR